MKLTSTAVLMAVVAAISFAGIGTARDLPSARDLPIRHIEFIKKTMLAKNTTFVQQVRAERVHQATVLRLKHEIRNQRILVWKWQSKGGMVKTKSVSAELRTDSVRYLHWIKALWIKRHLTVQAQVRHALAAESQWDRLDSNIYLANHFAAQLFRTSELTLNAIVGGEGGNISSGVLASSLCTGNQPGWNNWGSYAFGPYQFMMDRKPPCYDSSSWGTFGSNDDAAFAAASSRGVHIPTRYDTPASNLGQAIVGAYMVATGGIGPWCSSMC